MTTPDTQGDDFYTRMRARFPRISTLTDEDLPHLVKLSAEQVQMAMRRGRVSISIQLDNKSPAIQLTSREDINRFVIAYNEGERLKEQD